MQNQKFRPPRLCRVGVFKTLRRSGTFAAGTLPARRLRAVVAMSHKMSRAARALLALLVVCAPGRVSQGWGPATAHAWAPREVLSTDDLAANAYPSATHVPCVLLLNATGSIGCSTPAGGVTAPLRRFEGLADVRRRLASRTILLLPASAFPEVLADYAKGAGWKAHAAGFMLEPGVDEHGNPPPVSSAEPSSDEGNDRDAPSTAGATLARLLARIHLGARRSFSPQPRRDDDDRALHARAWNPDGFGAARARFENTPIVLLDASGADVARTFAAANGERGTSRVAEMRFPMDAAAAAKDANPARRCLEQRTCQPIGGHSVLASVPPSPSTPTELPQNIQNIRPYLLVAARLDATALFHDAAFGANAAMSGLVALTAVAKTYADAIQKTRESNDASSDVSRTIAFERFLNEDAVPIAFAAFGAEAWGRAGSRRFARLARDAARNVGVSVSDSNSERSRRAFLASEREETASRRETRTATRSSVDALPRWMRRGFELGGVIDFGAVGFAAGRETKNNATTSTVFAHANAAARNKEKAGFPLVASVEASFASSSNHLAFARASVAPGTLPPSSASSFSPSREKLGEGDGDVPAVVLAEYDGAYVDGTFGSAFDVGVAAVDTAKIASLVSGVAGALVSLAFGDAEYGALVRANLPDSASVERTTRALAECLIDPEVGFECALAQKLFTPSETFPSRYAGVAPSAVGKPDFDGEAEGRVGAGADDVARFAWSFLADATAPRGSASAGRGSARRACGDASDAGVSCADGEVCVRVAGDDESDESDESSPSETTSSEKKAQNEPRRALLGSDVFGADSGTGSGTCVESSARFLPALSRLVTFDDDENRWTFSPDDDEDDDADPDAVWCESDWPSSVGARVFREASATTEWAALVAGAAVTSLAVLLTNRLDAVARARFKEE